MTRLVEDAKDGTNSHDNIDRPELDITPVLEPTMTSCYMSLIGILMWIVELVSVDICLKVSVISLHMAIPIEGHLAQLFVILTLGDFIILSWCMTQVIPP